jgi:hypothetical protein
MKKDSEPLWKGKVAEMSDYAFFLGCITPNRYPGIEVASKKVLKEFGINLLDMKGASCCPAPGVFGSFDLATWLTLASRNLVIAEEMNMNIATTCNGCYATLQEANHLLKHDPKLKDRVNDSLAKVGKQYKGTIEVKHIIELLSDEIKFETIQKKVKRPLKGVKVAAFDTRYRMAAWLSGSAASDIARYLRRLGGLLQISPESFFIERDMPPRGEKRRHDLERLEAGVIERAAQWAMEIVNSKSSQR